MVKNRRLFEKFERNFIRKEPVDYERNIRIFSEMLTFAKEMGKMPPSDPLEGIDVDIKYARAINGIKSSSQKSRKGIK